jgi:hypothetical protein
MNIEVEEVEPITNACSEGYDVREDVQDQQDTALTEPIPLDDEASLRSHEEDEVQIEKDEGSVRDPVSDDPGMAAPPSQPQEEEAIIGVEDAERPIVKKPEIPNGVVTRVGCFPS